MSYSGEDDDWTPPPESGLDTENSTDSSDKQLWLFNIDEDPEEKNDLSGDDAYKSTLEDMLADLKAYYDDSRDVIAPDDDKTYDPTGSCWGPWATSRDDVPT